MSTEEIAKALSQYDLEQFRKPTVEELKAQAVRILANRAWYEHQRDLAFIVGLPALLVGLTTCYFNGNFSAKTSKKRKIPAVAVFTFIIAGCSMFWGYVNMQTIVDGDMRAAAIKKLLGD